jgi:transcriptional regulator with XRE-family HTH domain
VVKAAREGLGLTLGKLAKELSVTSVYLSQVEAGRRYPKIRWKKDMYWRLAQIFGDGWGDPMRFYANFVAIDLYERQPEVYLLLGRHFFAELQNELGQTFKDRQPRLQVRETAPHTGATKSNTAKT